MPQMRAVMSGASVKARPRRKASKKRGGSNILKLGALHRAVAHDDLERAFAFDASEIVDLDRLTAMTIAFLAERSGIGVEGSIDPRQRPVVHAEIAAASR